MSNPDHQLPSEHISCIRGMHIPWPANDADYYVLKWHGFIERKHQTVEQLHSLTKTSLEALMLHNDGCERA